MIPLPLLVVLAWIAVCAMAAVAWSTTARHHKNKGNRNA